MEKDFELKGIQDVMKKLNEAAGKLENRSMSGIIKAMILVHRSVETQEPKVPVDTGNLRHSWFYVTNRGKGKTNASFKGKDAGKMSGDHSAVVARAKATAQSERWPTGVFGFSANYGTFVHENLEPTVRWNRQGSGPKYLEAAIKREKNNMLKVIHEEAKL